MLGNCRQQLHLESGQLTAYSLEIIGLIDEQSFHCAWTI
jgi:hypothetical protein